MIFPRRIGRAQSSANEERARRLFSVLCALMMLFGCASQAYRAHPDFGARAKRLHVAGLMPCDVKIYEATGHGIVELRDDWSPTVKRSLVRALIMGFEKIGYHVEPVSVDEGTEAEIDEIQALYRSVNKSIRLHAYGPQVFPEKKRNFQYSIGSVEKFLEKLGADSLIFMHGVDHVLPGGEDGFVNVAVADSSGTIIWYCVRGFRGESGLRDAACAAELVENLIASYPEVSR
jgi:hypothetical protein